MDILAYGTTYKELVEFPAPREVDRELYMYHWGTLILEIGSLFPAPCEVDRELYKLVLLMILMRSSSFRPSRGR